MFTDQGTHVDRRVAAHNNVFAARSNGESGAHRHRVVARVADDLEAAYGSRSVKVAVVEPILRHDVVVEASKILVGQ
jgi:hypothetical protein